MSRLHGGSPLSSGMWWKIGARWLCAGAIWIGSGYLAASHADGGAGGFEQRRAAADGPPAQSMLEPIPSARSDRGAARVGGLVGHVVIAIDFNRLGREAFGDNEDSADAR